MSCKARGYRGKAVWSERSDMGCTLFFYGVICTSTRFIIEGVCFTPWSRRDVEFFSALTKCNGLKKRYGQWAKRKVAEGKRRCGAMKCLSPIKDVKKKNDVLCIFDAKQVQRSVRDRRGGGFCTCTAGANAFLCFTESCRIAACKNQDGPKANHSRNFSNY